MSCTQLKISLKNCNIRKTNFENLRQFFCDFFHVTSMERERERVKTGKVLEEWEGVR